MNKVILTGNLGNDPELYLTQDGRKIVTFSLATNHSWKDKTGEWQSATDWHQVSVFRDSTVRWIKDVLKRGHKVYVEGKLTYQHWTDKFGQPRVTSHVVVSKFGGKVEQFRPLQSTPKDNNLIPEKVQNSSSSLTADENVCPSLNLSKENSLATPSYQNCSSESVEKEQEDSQPQGETIYEH